MKIDVTQQLMNLDNTPIITGKRTCPTCGQAVSEPEPMTVRLAATGALTASFRTEPDLAGEQKVRRFHLALRLADEGKPDLKAEDIVLIKKLVGMMWGSVIVGRMWEILDPPE